MMAACVEPVELDHADQQIVGGTQVTSADFPTVVGLLQGGNNWFCTGVLVDKDWVMTSASCFDGVGTAQVRLDDSTLGDGGGRTVAIAEIRKHPSFDINSNTWAHDLALIKLAQPVTDRVPSIIRRDPVAIASSVTQVGFGVRNNNGDGGGQLRSLATSSIDCAQANDNGISNANLICFDAGDGNGSCYGDGGAPALIGPNKAVAGIASGGTSNSCTQGLDVYTSIAAEVAFIDAVLPAATPPTQDPPADGEPPPTTEPDPADPQDPDGGNDRRVPTVRGCDAGGGAGSTGALLALGLALLARRRRSQAAAR